MLRSEDFAATFRAVHDPAPSPDNFIPTSSSWLNLVERWFGEITRDRIRRGTFESVSVLVAAIEDYLRHYNEAPRPFIWTKDADMILDKIARCPKPLNA